MYSPLLLSYLVPLAFHVEILYFSINEFKAIASRSALFFLCIACTGAKRNRYSLLAILCKLRDEVGGKEVQAHLSYMRLLSFLQRTISTHSRTGITMNKKKARVIKKYKKNVRRLKAKRKKLLSAKKSL